MVVLTARVNLDYKYSKTLTKGLKMQNALDHLSPRRNPISNFEVKQSEKHLKSDAFLYSEWRVAGVAKAYISYTRLYNRVF